MLQIISAVIKDAEDKTNVTLLFANQVSELNCVLSVVIFIIDTKSFFILKLMEGI